MSTSVLDQEMPSVFSAVFEAIKDSKNPTVEANHPMASTNVLRVKIPSGVSTVQVSTNYAGRYQVVHQTTKNGVAVNNRVWFESGGGGLPSARSRRYVHALCANGFADGQRHGHVGRYGLDYPKNPARRTLTAVV